MRDHSFHKHEEIKYTGKQSFLLTVIFLTFIGGMAVMGLLMPDRTFSEIENRSLTQFRAPTLHTILNGSFMANSDSYLTDQVPLRDQWVQVHAGLEMVSGRHDVEGICKTEEGNLISLLPERDTSIAWNNLRYVTSFAQETGLPLYLGLIPTSADVLNNQLPAGAPTMDEVALIRDLYESYGDSLKTLDIRGTLQEHKDEYIYYRTDHHWTSLGACYGANVLLEALQKGEGQEEKDMELLDPEAMTRTTVSRSFYGSNCSRSGIFSVTPDEIDTYIPAEGIEVTVWHGMNPESGALYQPEYLDKKDKYSYFLGGNMPLGIIRTRSQGPKLLLIRDSYSSSMVPFLTGYFSEIHMVDMRYYRMSLRDYVKEQEIDEVAVIYGLQTFLEDSNLAFLRK